VLKREVWEDGGWALVLLMAFVPFAGKAIAVVIEVLLERGGMVKERLIRYIPGRM
jgi:hypothetical protein